MAAIASRIASATSGRFRISCAGVILVQQEAQSGHEVVGLPELGDPLPLPAFPGFPGQRGHRLVVRVRTT